MNLDEESKVKVGKSANRLFTELQKKYPNTGIMLLSGLAEGADRIVSSIALELGIDVCPIMPMPIDRYKETFAGYGYNNQDESCRDFDSLLERSLSPYFLNYDDVNEIQAFRALAAYLVSNSHILIAAWDGVASDYRGGTYDTLRMAYSGVDLDLIQSTSPRGFFAVDGECRSTNYLNSNEDTLIYWVKVKRGEVKERYTPDPKQVVLTMRNCVPEGLSVPNPVFVNSLMRTANKDDLSRAKACDCISIIPDEYVPISETMPEEYDSMFSKMQYFNVDSGLLEYDAEEAYARDGCGLLTDDGQSSGYRSEGLLKQMACRFGIADHLAMKYQAKSRREITVLTYITVFYTVLFNLMILFSEAVMFMLGYGALYALATFFTWNHARGRNHVKSIEYRSLAETLRVEFYWSILRLSGTTSDNSYGYLKNGMSWMRAFMKGAASSFTNDYSKCADIPSEEAIDYVKDKWIVRQIEYGRDKSNRDLKRFKLLSDSDNVLKLTLSCLTICSIAMIVIFPEWSKEIISTSHDLINNEEMNISAYTVIKVMMIIVMNVTTILVMSMSHISNSSKVKVKARAMFYFAALSKLATVMQTSNSRNIRKSLGILNELGHQAVTENNDWVSESAKRDFTKQRGLMTSINRFKGNQSRSGPLEIEMEDGLDNMGD